ncbi:hypothetical protein [Novosphingobium sp. Leaf2]|uniref:hypothetical protein n=1 Tax=Novosphingobium sp. Leaf2 TaxID=1735670 RepID=UPI0006FF7F1E|nr:hypothetical protein [Novosphingobium sp. Leaf2]KQM21803.1 phosphoesterase [Novosphingobium sp. Leaf2]
MAIHFVANLHFDCEDARREAAAGVSHTAELTRRICETWHRRVDAADTVWILGNVGNPVHLAGLPGIKHLVRSANDPRPWDCLSTGRYASVCEFTRLETPAGRFDLVSDPVRALIEDGVGVLHGRADAAWQRAGIVCVCASRNEWGPISLDDLTRTGVALRQAA